MVGLLIIARLILLFSQEDYFLPLLKNCTISTSVFAFKLDDFTEHALSFCQVPEAGIQLLFTLGTFEKRLSLGGYWCLLPSNKQQDNRKWPQVRLGEVEIGYEEKCLH